MTRKMTIAITLAAALSVLGFFIFHVRLVQETVLDIKGPDGQIFASLVLPDRRFDHVFIHSIHLTPVIECFTVEKAGNGDTYLHLFELRYQSSGVGMPSDAENGYRLENGVFILSMNRTFRTIPVMVSIVDGHGVSVGGKLYPFKTWVEAEERILLSARFLQRIQFKR